MASAWLSPVAAMVFVGLEQGQRAGGVHQRRNPTPFRDAEIPKPLLWRGLERCRAAGRHRLDAVPFRWRTALVYVFGCLKWRVRRWPPVRVPPLLSACLREPAGIGSSARAWEIPEDPNAAGRKPEHA